jgi:dTDP-4-amino-4,6-dideoxygalactose transaminase
MASIVPLYRKSDVKYRVCGNLFNTAHIMNDTFLMGVCPGLSEEHLKYILKKFYPFMDERLLSKSEQ